MNRFFFSKKKRNSFLRPPVSPEEILLDANNSLSLNRNRSEGKIERALTKRSVYLLGAIFCIVTLLYSGRLWLLQVSRGQAYFDRSTTNHLAHSLIFASRGIIYDRTGQELAWNEDGDDDFPLRRYSELPGLAHVLGYATYPQKDSKGVYYREEYEAVAGVEKSFDSELRGTNGLQLKEVDALREPVSESTIQEPVDGRSLRLSIDARVESELYTAMKNLAEEVDFQGGAGVIMDVHTGEILAMASFPEYSPDEIVNPSLHATSSPVHMEHTPFLNRATQGLYTPGSIVKPFMGIAALNEGLITPSTKILSTGEIRVQNPYDPTDYSVFVDWRPQGWVNVKEAIAVSSDIFFYEVGGGFEDQPGLGITKIENYMHAFGIGEETGIKGFAESQGTIPNPEWKKRHFNGDIWRLGDTYHTSIGQYGFQVTPLEMARAYAAIANGGTLLTPTIIEGAPVEKKPVGIDIPQSDYEVIREGMRLGVTDGISGGLNISGVTVAGKTGTAELDSGKTMVNSWITGFFPYEHPRYSFAIVMERGPYTNLTGATFAMRNVLLWMRDNTPEYVK